MQYAQAFQMGKDRRGKGSWY